MSTGRTPPVVSVVTPVYNGERYLDDLLRSVVGQRGVSIEHVLVDDGSTDGSLAILRDWERRFPHVVRVASRENRGQYASMNDGLAMATGSLVLFLCADDRLALPDSLAKAESAWRRDGMPDVVHGRWRVIDDSGHLKSGPLLTGRLPRAFARYVNLLSHCAMLVRRDTLAAKGVCFDPVLRTTGDYDFILNLLERGFSFRSTRAVIADYRLHPRQATRRSDQLKRRNEASAVVARHGLKPSLCWLGDLVVGVLREAQAVLHRSMTGIRRAICGEKPIREQWREVE